MSLILCKLVITRTRRLSIELYEPRYTARDRATKAWRGLYKQLLDLYAYYGYLADALFLVFLKFLKSLIDDVVKCTQFGAWFV
jgi:hypothetical protein